MNERAHRAEPNRPAEHSAPEDPLFDSYARLASSMLGDIVGQCLLDRRLRPIGQIGRLDAEAAASWLRSLGWAGEATRLPTTAGHRGGEWLTAIPLAQSDGELLGVFCVQQRLQRMSTPESRHAKLLQQHLKPMLDCLHRELAARQRERSKVRTLTERTAELEWLFKIAGTLKSASDDRRALEELLAAAVERLKSAYVALSVPARRLQIDGQPDATPAEGLRGAWTQSRQHLLTWVQRRRQPLVVNTAGRAEGSIARCKLLAVPLMQDTGRVIGVLAFFNPPDADDYGSRQVFLARHLGRQVAAIVEAQFDLMTGLYTRDGLQQVYGRLAAQSEGGERSLLYVDIDRMQIVNELHGFELGNELIVRVADLLSAPLLPEGTLAARVSGDRFAIVLPNSGPDEAGPLADRLRAAASKLVIGPADAPVEITVSCGVAALVDMPQGLARAIAAAEIACKAAKQRGRDRTELYTCDDRSMLRPRTDAIAVGEMRSAFKHGRALLYAQRIAPLRDVRQPGGYEILLRLRDAKGGIVSPGPMIDAAHRHRLLPSIDRWVLQQALQALAPYRSLLKSRGVSISINISGQSLGEDAFVRLLLEQLAAAGLPPGSIILEITEQAAVTNLAKAHDVVQALQASGCRIALDDFGTGANTLSYLKDLHCSRVKIDGSFVRDLLTNQRSQATVSGIVELARGLAMETVAEYVENHAIAGMLREMGVDFAQGEAFGMAEPLERVLRGLSGDESRRLHKLYLEM